MPNLWRLSILSLEAFTAVPRVCNKAKQPKNIEHRNCSELFEAKAARFGAISRPFLSQFMAMFCLFIQKNPSPPPPPKTPNSPPPLKREILWTWGFSCRTDAFFPGAHKIGAAISSPRIADRKVYGHEDFSELNSY